MTETQGWIIVIAQPFLFVLFLENMIEITIVVLTKDHLLLHLAIILLLGTGSFIILSLIRCLGCLNKYSCPLHTHVKDGYVKIFVRLIDFRNV